MGKIEINAEQYIKQEFSRIAEEVIAQGEGDVIFDLIPLEAKKDFIKSYTEE